MKIKKTAAKLTAFLLAVCMLGTTALAYDGVYTILAAIEKSGATADMDASTLCDALKAAMTEITVDGLTGEGMQWEATGEVNKAPRAMKIENGAYTAM